MIRLKLTPEDILAKVVSTEYVVFGGRLTICVMTLANGFMVTGESCPVSAESFDEKIGAELAYKAAVDKVWALEGYMLRERLSVRADEPKIPVLEKPIGNGFP